MGEVTKIEWASHTFNPWRGCTKCSPGCTNCYAEKQAKRNPAVLGEWGDKGKRVAAAESYWKKPVAWNKEAKAAGVRRKVFCLSFGDVFEDRPELVAPRERLAELIDSTPHLLWMLLTKRPRSIKRLWPGATTDWPNIGWGVTVENQAKADERIPILLRVPAALRFVSAEPLLGPVDMLKPAMKFYTGVQSDSRVVGGVNVGIDWVIIGGESGHGARPCNIEWIREIVQQCQEAHTPVFCKQLGSHVQTNGCTGPGEHWPRESGMFETAGGLFRKYLVHKKGGDPAEWPADLRVREYPERQEAAR